MDHGAENKSLHFEVQSHHKKTLIKVVQWLRYKEWAEQCADSITAT